MFCRAPGVSKENHRQVQTALRSPAEMATGVSVRKSDAVQAHGGAVGSIWARWGSNRVHHLGCAAVLMSDGGGKQFQWGEPSYPGSGLTGWTCQACSRSSALAARLPSWFYKPPAEQHPLCPGCHGGAANGRARALAKDKALQNTLGFVTELPCIRALAAISWCGALYKYTCKSCHLTGQVCPRGPVTLCGRSASGALAASSFSILLGTLLSMPGPAPVGFFDHRDLQNKAGRYFPWFGSLLKRLCEPVSLLTPWSFPAMATLAQKVPDLLSHGRMPMENSMREGMEDEREIPEIVCSSFNTVSLWVRNESQLAERREHWPLSWSSQVLLPALLLNEPCSPSPYRAMWKRQD